MRQARGEGSKYITVIERLASLLELKTEFSQAQIQRRGPCWTQRCDLREMIGPSATHDATGGAITHTTGHRAGIVRIQSQVAIIVTHDGRPRDIRYAPTRCLLGLACHGCIHLGANQVQGRHGWDLRVALVLARDEILLRPTRHRRPRCRR